MNKHSLVTLLTNVGKVYDGKSWKGSGIRKQICQNPEFNWIEDKYGARYCRLAADYAASSGVVVLKDAGVAPAYIFTVGDVIKNGRTGENMLVTAITNTTTLAVTNAYGTTASVAGLAGDGIFIIGNANAEGSSFRNVNSTRAVKNGNYTQIG